MESRDSSGTRQAGFNRIAHLFRCECLCLTSVVNFNEWFAVTVDDLKRPQLDVGLDGFVKEHTANLPTRFQLSQPLRNTSTVLLRINRRLGDVQERTRIETDRNKASMPEGSMWHCRNKPLLTGRSTSQLRSQSVCQARSSPEIFGKCHSSRKHSILTRRLTLCSNCFHVCFLMCSNRFPLHFWSCDLRGGGQVPCGGVPGA